MEAAHRGAAEPGSAFDGGMNPTVFLKIPVQLLKVTGGQLAELDVPDAGNGIDIHHQLIAVLRRQADIGLGVELIPGMQPNGYRIIVRAADVQTLGFLNRLFQLFLDLSLCLAQYISDDPLTGIGVVAGSIPTLPAAVRPFANIALAIGSFLCHKINSFVMTHNTIQQSQPP
ncbi:hypothetical protein SDC9_55634 [bioreactor metagenome]|uniref:Uncharacterized protein n=1 Tax=bioreactor metagenome TaxID=1076179 RepID=A0A644X0J1_9ZZZZ